MRLAPALESMIQPGDQVIAIAKGSDSIHPSMLSDTKIHPPAVSITSPAPRKPERTLILGWNIRWPADHRIPG